VTDSVNGVPPAEEPSASATPSPDAQTSSDELARLRAKLELVSEDKRRAGEKNADLNRKLQELEESLRATQAQLKDGQTAKLAESGEYRKLWEDAKETNLALERQIADLNTQLDAERQARATETLKSAPSTRSPRPKPSAQTNSSPSSPLTSVRSKANP
jgi:chromosome segregation ATPase